MRIETRGQRAAVWGVAAAMFVVLMIVTPKIPQDQKYHQFADKRNFFGIPNTLNVVSNFPFLVIGIVGLVLTLHGNNFGLSLQGEVLGWSIFFVGITATAFGSAYYHLQPNDARLVWDRLPMTVGFASVMAVFIIERIDETTGRASIFPLLIAGAGSVAYWRFANDLRIYALVQFVPCFAIPAMAILLPPKYSHSHYWLWAAGWYLLAKIQEALDMKFYRWTHFLVSGHTLKHLSAAMVPVMTIIMLYSRNLRVERLSLLDKWRQQMRTSSPRGSGDSLAQKWKSYWSGRPNSSSLLHDESESLVRA
ncbi:hypothetical protein KC19_4G056400 [Ceratodon purpureus]|uniref:Ceramidase n=3 Tax=Ceratodon purpureus TaxID=3225 RepID=A0A8T0I5G3_CERPU|nr:hypothetical protein KC19_4G056400 [Ceratodon purpureus]